jgi:UDP-N-acetylmuramate dehydrogenase
VNTLDRLQRELVKRGYGPRLRVGEPLSRHTSFAIGGPTDLLIVARKAEEIRELMQVSRELSVPVLVLGAGSNVLVADAGVRGLVVVNACEGRAMDGEGLLIVQAGAPLREVAHETAMKGWAGLEWAVGIPGTVGGAVVGNAGAYGGCMSDIVHWVTWLDPSGECQRVGASALGYGYRTSTVKREVCRERRPVVLEAALRLTAGDAQELALKVQSLTVQRKARTPEGLCAGSIFKRTEQFPAGFLIEQAGLKGRRLGGAEVSPKHANFVMNTGGATAADVRALIELIQREVWAAFGQRLEPEIECVGEWS